MKKYICPEVSITMVQTAHQLMAGSAKGSSVIDESVATADEQAAVLARRRTVWDDDEEMEEEEF